MKSGYHATQDVVDSEELCRKQAKSIPMADMPLFPWLMIWSTKSNCWSKSRWHRYPSTTDWFVAITSYDKPSQAKCLFQHPEIANLRVSYKLIQAIIHVGTHTLSPMGSSKLMMQMLISI